jgi:hypothetical protein
MPQATEQAQNVGDQQLATMGLSTPQDVRARLLHRLVLPFLVATSVRERDDEPFSNESWAWRPSPGVDHPDFVAGDDLVPRKEFVLA